MKNLSKKTEERLQKNFVLKVINATPKEIKEALKARDIEVVSLAEIYQETLPEESK